MYQFELGPIRPPSEAGSILIRLTRNCPWNRCAFCPVYKGQKFSRRSVDEIKSDIDSIAHIYNKLSVKLDNAPPKTKLGDILFGIMSEEKISPECLNQVFFWMRYGMKNVFLQDADSLILKADVLVEILNHLTQKLPSVERITSYSRAKTISKKLLDELKSIRGAGLSRLHLGLESGSDDVLQMVKKGVSSLEQIDAGKKIMSAGFELSEYFMPGLGGTKLSKKHAEESAKVLNEINPTFIRLRSTVPVPNTPLYILLENGNWTPLSEEEKILEIKLFIEKLEGITSRIESDHIMNLIEDINGSFPDEKEKMIKSLDTFLNMNADDKESFIVGRRLGRFRFLADFNSTPELEKIKSQMKEEYDSIDSAVAQIVRRYV
jgi:radical SAM superfamily enzyme YgiQ (UPF0313 family)